MTIELCSADYVGHELGRAGIAAHASVNTVNKAGCRFPRPDGIFGVSCYPGWRPARVDDIAAWFDGEEVEPGPNTSVRYYSTTQVAVLLGLDPRRIKQWVIRFDVASATPFPAAAASLLWPPDKPNQDGWTRGQISDIEVWAQPLLAATNRTPRLSDEEIVALHRAGTSWAEIARRAGMSTTSMRRHYEQATNT